MRSIMIIGWFAEGFSGEPISRGFERLGYIVTRVSADPLPKSRIQKHDLHLLEFFTKGKNHPNDEAMLIKMKYRQIPIADLESIFDVDYILILQNQFDYTVVGCHTPIYYYYTEINDPAMPEGPVAGIIGGFVGAIEKLQKAHPYQVNCAKQIMIPYGLTILKPKEIPSMADRKVFVGFMGQRDFNARSSTASIKYTYYMRNIYLDTLEQWSKSHVLPVEIRIRSNYVDYITFMTSCRIAINVPGIEGKINQRQYEALACGCVLLQEYYPELVDLGFIDSVNCLTYSNKTELCLKLDWACNHPQELETIRQNGMKLIIETDCSWIGRATLFHQFLESKNHDELLEYAISTSV